MNNETKQIFKLCTERNQALLNYIVKQNLEISSNVDISQSYCT